jgi:protein-L-isoaspartate(D-aspartate) O-methyltransferase
MAIICCGIINYVMGSGSDKPDEPENRREERQRMVEYQLRRRGIRDERVLDAMESVPRHMFVSPVDEASAYEDSPLPIGWSQTISQPYIVALMTELCRPEPDARVLEIGSGSGYQTAILAELVAEVYSIEFIERLARRAGELLRNLGYKNVHVRTGNGYAGWPEAAPFDAIVVTAAPPDLPQALLDQLAPGGRLVIPVGIMTQELFLVEKTAGGFEKRKITDVRFVPMVHGDDESQK